MPLFHVRHGDPPIVHVVPKILRVFLEQWAKISMHHPLEERRSIHKPEVHCLQNIGAIIGLKHCFVLVLFLYPYVVITLSNVEF